MTSNVFLDSSIFIEPLRGQHIAFYTKLVSNPAFDCCINTVVVSEYLYKFLGMQNAGSPKTVESKGEIAQVLQLYFQKSILSDYTYLNDHEDLVFMVPQLMAKYNLLPNDAIILAICKIHDITQLATHDSDFDVAAPTEGIQILKEGSQLIMDN